MSTDLTMLVWSAVLTFVQVLPYVNGRLLTNWTLADAVGNREKDPPDAAWVGRAVRAHTNMVENLPIFAALVLVAHVTSHANAMTALGAQIFFWARLVYAGVYIAGIPYLRTLVWLVSIIGMAIIFFQIV
ncbi:MAG TPA: MAPEG family protein [Candidatus Cybelea sp.]|nr:MAPEG family protein [Candidatus Cybelea sp.]